MHIPKIITTFALHLYLYMNIDTTQQREKLINKVRQEGYVDYNLELKTSKNCQPYTIFNLIQRNSEVNKIHFCCIAYNEVAVMICDIVKRGNRIIVDGELSYYNYEDKKGIERWNVQIKVHSFKKVD